MPGDSGIQHRRSEEVMNHEEKKNELEKTMNALNKEKIDLNKNSLSKVNTSFI